MLVGRVWDLVEICILALTVLLLYIHLSQHHTQELYTVLLLAGVLIVIKCIRFITRVR